jgi:hypothetical protein
METPAYRYSERSRRPLTLGALAVAAAVFALGLSQGAPAVWLAIVGLPTLGLLAVVLGNAETWIVVDAEALVWNDARREVRIPRQQIARVEVKSWTESTDVIVHLADGGSEDIPDCCRPVARRLAAELAARGYPVAGDTP